MKLTPKVYADEAEKRRDRWRGFWLWWGINIGLVLIYAGAVLLSDEGIIPQPSNSGIAGILLVVISVLPFIINIAAPILLAFTRPQMALGMLIAMAVAFGVVIVLGVLASVGCFILILTSGGA